jgi:4-alpha-glucanotransferase
MKAATELADLVRIDHFRGFEAYWSVPAEATNARTGEWLTGPGDAIFDAMRKALGKLPIVAEDLGVITPAVESLRDRHSFPGMVVLQFAAADADFDPKAVPEYSVCYTGTHDNDTTVGWFCGSPGDLRSRDEVRRTQRAVLKLTGGSPGTIHMDLVRLAFATDARLSIAPLQDFLGLGSEARINTPGTARGNWAWRVRPDQVSDRVCAQVAETVDEFCRAVR